MKKISTFIAIMIAVVGLTAANAHGQATSLSETTLDFGCVELGSQGQDIVSVTNVSGFDIIVSASVADAGATASGFSTDWTGFVLLPHTFSTDVNVYFDPIANGDATDVLVIDVLVNDDDPNPPSVEQATVDLIGTGGATTDPCVLIDSILDFLDVAVDMGTLQGVGSGNKAAKRLNAMRRRIETIDFLIQNGYGSAACAQTANAIRRSDGEPSPGDFIEGPATQELNDLLVLLKILLEG